MMTECNSQQLHFSNLGRRRVTVKFDGGHLTSDGGGVLLREVDRRIGLLERLAHCFRDHRNQAAVEHPVRDLLAQRIYALALGYEDLNDHDSLRADPLLALLVGKADVTGQNRSRRRDKGRPLASAAALNRLELSRPEEAAADRYKRIGADTARLDRLLWDLYLEAHDRAPQQIVLDLDATDDPLHGKQEGRFFHGYYRSYCYLPLYVFGGEQLLLCRLRRANTDPGAGVAEELRPLIDRIRSAWPDTQIVLRADSGFARDKTMSWCEEEGIYYVFGLARNTRLQQLLGRAMAKSRRRHIATGKPARRFRQFRYRTLQTWSRRRRVVGKAEYLAKGANPRFVVTNLPAAAIGKQALYEKLYCPRGEMENRIKELQLALFSDRTSAATMHANQLRLYLSGFAYVLLAGLRRLGLAGTGNRRRRCDSLRLKLLKVAGRIRISHRRIWLSLPSAYPWRKEFAGVLSRLAGIPAYQMRPG